MSPPAITLSTKNLDVRVPGRTLVESLDVDFRTGEFLAILGQNGAGKTLTLHTLAGLREPSGGELTLNSSSMTSLPRRIIARTLALLPQDSDDLFPATVFDTVLIGRHPHVKPLRLESAQDRDIALRCLRKLDLADLVDRDVTTLSGGERRRLAIAQALAQTPQIYLLDEPLNHLDPQHQLEVLELFTGMARDGATVVTTLHDVNLALRYADRCLLLFGDGRWKLGDTQDVLTLERASDLFNVRMESTRWNGTQLFVAVGNAHGPDGP